MSNATWRMSRLARVLKVLTEKGRGFAKPRGKNAAFRGDKPANNGDNPGKSCLTLAAELPRFETKLGKIVGDGVTSCPADCRDRRLPLAAAFARPCAVVVTHSRRFRGMRRRGREGGDQGG